MLLCLIVTTGLSYAQLYGADGLKNFQIGFEGITITDLTEYPEFDLTRHRILQEAKSTFYAAGGEITLESLQAVAQRITTMYREVGFVFTRAYVPQQRSHYGGVEIRLLEGFLESVDIYDNNYFDEDQIRAAFEPLIGQVITNADIEEAMALTNDLPGLNVFGFYSIGEQLGGTRLNLRVREEKTRAGALRIDNHGSDLTGETRVLAEWEQYNLLGHGDSLRLGAMQTFDPDNADYGFLDFKVTMDNARDTAGLSIATYSYALGRGTSDIGRLDLVGETDSISFSYARKLRRSLLDSRVMSLSINQDESTTRSQEFPELLDVTTDSLDMGLSYTREVLNREARRWRSSYAEVKLGQYQEGTPESQSDNFSLFRLDNTVGFGVMPFFSERYHQLQFSFNGQYSEDLLPPDEQFSLTGASALRGFDPSYFSADSGLRINSEWIFPGHSLFDIVSVVPSLFVEYAYGVQRSLSEGASDDWAEVVDAGLGLNISVDSDLSVEISAAKPLTERISYSDEESDDMRVYAQMIWRFR